MPTDTSILVAGTSAVPLSYGVPNAVEIQLLCVNAVFDGSGAAGSFAPTLELVNDGGVVISRIPVSTALVVGGSAEVSWFPGGRLTAAAAAGLPTTETFYLNTHTGPVTSSTVLQAGVSYLVSVQGTYSAWNEDLNMGTPEPNPQFPPSSAAGRASTEVGVDADTLFGWPSTHPHVAGHDVALEMDLGSGYAHVEPFGGPYTVPTSDHFYSYTLVGQGATLSVRTNDVNLGDDYGLLKITIYAIPAGGGGTVTAVASSDTSIAVATPSVTPTLTVAPLSTLAANNPPAADWSNNGFKIRNLASGVAATDAATVAQITAIPGAGQFVQLYDSTLAALAASFDITGIAAGYTQLMGMIYGRSDAATTAVLVNVRFNNDAGANYTWAQVHANAATATGGAGALLANAGVLGSISAATAPAGAAGSFTFYVPQYAGTTFQKNAWSGGSRVDTTLAAGFQIQDFAMTWLNTAAVNRITLIPATGNWIAGSRVTLWGMV